MVQQQRRGAPVGSHRQDVTVLPEPELDIFKDGISVSSLTLKYMFQDLPDYFTLQDEKNKDLYQLYKNNIVGGPSIVFHRYHERDVTTIRPRDYEESKACKKIFGYDANAFYLWSIMQEMPTGHFVNSQTLRADGDWMVGMGSPAERIPCQTSGQPQRESDRTSAPSSGWLCQGNQHCVRIPGMLLAWTWLSSEPAQTTDGWVRPDDGTTVPENPGEDTVHPGQWLSSEADVRMWLETSEERRFSSESLCERHAETLCWAV